MEELTFESIFVISVPSFTTNGLMPIVRSVLQKNIKRAFN